MYQNAYPRRVHGLVLAFIIVLAGCRKDLKDTGIATPPTQSPTPVLTPNLSTSGIGGYDIHGLLDQAVAYDYQHSGTPDYLIMYRPGYGFCWVLTHTLQNTFVPVYKAGLKVGIGGYDLTYNWDLITTFDYEHSGRQDYLVAYRPGLTQDGNAIYIIKDNWSITHPTANFQAVFPSHSGIGGVGIWNPTKITAFDYEHSGKLDYLLIALFGDLHVWIVKHNSDGSFSPVFQSTSGLDQDLFDGYYSTDVVDNAKRDYIFAFDYNHSGLRDHLVHCTTDRGYGPDGSYFHTNIYIDENNNGSFTTKAHIKYDDFIANSYAYESISTQCVAFDYEHSGKADYLLVVQPSPTSPRVYILKNNNDGTFTTIYQAINGEGLGGWDFRNFEDRIIAYDYDHSGKLDYFFVYRAGAGVCSIIKNTNGVFTPVL